MSNIDLGDHYCGLRFISLLIMGFACAGFLTWFMYILIQSGDNRLDESKRMHIADFVRVKQAESTQVKKRLPPKPQVAKAPPVPEAVSDTDLSDSNVINISGVEVDTNIDVGADLSFGGGDGEYFPIVKVAPIYPLQAAAQKISGPCMVVYTVTTIGTVKDVRIVEEQCVHRYFHKPSIKAALKFKYKPRVIDGEAIEVESVYNRFIFNLVDE